MSSMSLSGYARYRGCSKSTVSAAIKSGRITADRVSTGLRKVELRIDSVAADQQWEQNTDPTQGWKAQNRKRKQLDPHAEQISTAEDFAVDDYSAQDLLDKFGSVFGEIAQAVIGCAPQNRCKVLAEVIDVLMMVVIHSIKQEGRVHG